MVETRVQNHDIVRGVVIFTVNNTEGHMGQNMGGYFLCLSYIPEN